MKNKKLFLPAIILVVAILTIAIYSVVSSLAFKPAVTEGEFPFSITYELDGEQVVIEDVYRVRYVGNSGYADTMSRSYVGELKSSGEESPNYIIKEDENTRIELSTRLYPDYLMGDSEYDYFDDEVFEPQFYYYDSEETEYYDEETLAAQGVKLISFDYPTPIENSLEFSHISYFSGAIVLPTLLIALIAFLVIIIFVKKEKELKYKTIDVVSIICNFVIFFTVIPFVTILAMLIDINGGGPEFYRQMFYFVPSFMVLCIAASVALRRKAYGVQSFIAELIGPAIFGVYLLVLYVCELL